MSNYTTRVGARAELAKALKTKLERAQQAGLTEDDLDEIAKAGDDAREADREQTIELTASETERTDRGASTDAIIERGDALRTRVPAAIRSLTKNGQGSDANFLAALSVARFRLRGLPEVDPALAADPNVKKVERVEREDKINVLEGLAKLAAILVTREHIVAELGRRGFDKDALTKLSSDADSAARAGKNLKRAAAATEREREAVERQKEAWNVSWRMIRKAVQGDEHLEKLYSQC